MYEECGPGARGEPAALFTTRSVKNGRRAKDASRPRRGPLRPQENLSKDPSTISLGNDGT